MATVRGKEIRIAEVSGRAANGGVLTLSYSCSANALVGGTCTSVITGHRGFLYESINNCVHQ